MQTINIGMIGGGFMCKSHSNAYRTAQYIFTDIGARAHLSALCVRDGNKAPSIAERYGFNTFYTSLEALLANRDIDLFDVCVPAEYHKSVSLPIIGAGKNLLCEKPLALTVADAKEMLASAEEKGVRHFVGFNYRFMPAVRMAQKMIADGVIGHPRHMRVRYFQQSGADQDKLFETIRYVRTPNCGTLQEIGTHAIDQMRFLFGEISALGAMTATYTRERKSQSGDFRTVAVEDVASAIVSFQNGATGVLECSGAFWGQKNHLSWEIFCSEGTLTWDLESPNYLGIYIKNNSDYADGTTMVNVTGGNHPYAEYWWPGAHNLGWEHAQINMIAGILENLAGGNMAQPVATFLDGYRTAVIVDAVRESARTGNRIDLMSRYEF